MKYFTGDAWSHPNTPLINHLLVTSKNIENLVENVTIPTIQIDTDIVNPNIIKALAVIMGGLHDLGKATTYFQEYLREPNPQRKQKLKQKPETHHSLIGSLYAFYAIPRSSILKSMNSYLTKLQLAFLISIAIRRHHGNIKSLRKERGYLRDEIKNINKPEKAITKQLNSINTAYMNDLLCKLEGHLQLSLPSWDEFRQPETKEIMKHDIRKLMKAFNTIETTCNNFARSTRSAETDTPITLPHSLCYMITLLESYYYSLLQEADKTSAMDKNVLQREHEHFVKALEDYYSQTFNVNLDIKQQEPLGSLNNLYTTRSKVFKEARAHALHTFDQKQRIFKLEAPTGSGKTLANLEWAFQLRLKLHTIKSKMYRIIYLLPYLSIIEQTHHVIETVLKNRYPEKPPSTILLKHHHLVDMAFTTGDDSDEYTPNEELFFLEGWNSEIILSTFYQFFHSVFTRNKKNLRKYHKFMNTIIILDEIQAIPLRYWKLLEETLPLFLAFTDSYLLMSTATQPAILNAQAQPITSIGHVIYQNLRRVVLHYTPTPLPYDSLIPAKIQEGYFDHDLSTIIIVNTTQSARTIYQNAKEHGLDKKYQVFQLSTQVIPKHRLQRISTIMNHLQNTDMKPPLLITTQLVEAGVDVNFQQGFRDLAPFDSIIQASGRINRSGIDIRTKKPKEHTPVLVQPLLNPSTKRLLASYIYDRELLEETKKIFEAHTPIPESKFQELLHEYFRRSREKTNEEDARKLLYAFCKADYNTIQEFQLIPEEYPRIPVFIEYDEHAHEIWETYKHLAQEHEWRQRQAQYLKLKKPLYEYVINVPQDRLHNVHQDLEVYGGLTRLPNPLVPLYYDKDMGFHGGEQTRSKQEWVL